MNRRGFLSALGIASVAPAIVRAESLMKIWVLPESVAADVASLARKMCSPETLLYKLELLLTEREHRALMALQAMDPKTVIKVAPSIATLILKPADWPPPLSDTPPPHSEAARPGVDSANV